MDFQTPRDHPKPVKTSETTVALYENKVSKKQKKRAPEVHFCPIWEVFLRSVADFSDFFSIFGASKKTSKKRHTEEAEPDPVWSLKRANSQKHSRSQQLKAKKLDSQWYIVTRSKEGLQTPFVPEARWRIQRHSRPSSQRLGGQIASGIY